MKFDYAASAREVEAARRALHIAYGRMTRRSDADDPRTRAWLDAVARFNAALERAYPGDFWQKFEQLKRVSRRCGGLGGAIAPNRRELSRGDVQALEAAIQFLEADPMFFRSGYVKAAIIPLVTRMPLSEPQKDRLRGCALGVVDMRASQEFRRYCRLARAVDSPSLRASLQRRVDGDDAAVARRARWMLAALTGGAQADT
jgi:hypothetical protein